jgi:hypothetical protein
MIAQSSFKSSYSQLLAEAFGMSGAPTGFFLDTGQSGLLGLLEGVDAVAASTPLPAGGETIASHCGHVLFILQMFDSFERGEPVRPDWPASWRVAAVTELEWRDLLAELRSLYRTVAAHFERRTEWPDQALGAWLMLLPHVAYHVGVIDKMLALLP